MLLHLSVADFSPVCPLASALLKKEIADHLETIRQLKEEHQFVPILMAAPRRESTRSVPDPQMALCHLAQSMVDNKTIPSSPTETFRFTKPPRRRSAYVPDANLESFDRRRRSRRVEISQSASPQPTQPAATPQPISPPLGRDSSAPRPPSILQSVSPQNPERGFFTVPIPPSNSASQAQLARQSLGPEKPGTDSTSLPPQPEGQHGKLRKVWGTIRSDSASQEIEAHIDPSIDANLISRSLASRMQFDIGANTGKNVSVLRKGEPVENDGSVWFRWNAETISGYVCPGLEHPVILGRSFLSK